METLHVRETGKETEKGMSKLQDEEEDFLNQGVGLGVLLVTLAIALVIVTVGITVPVIEAQEPAGLEKMESDMRWIKEELQYNWLPAVKEQRQDIQELERRIHDLELALKAIKVD